MRNRRLAFVFSVLAAAAALAASGCTYRTGTGDPLPGESGVRGDTSAVDTTRVEQRQYGALAFVEFADTLHESDLEWLRKEGFKIEKVFRETHSVTVRIPLGYGKDPKKENPRIVRFEVMTVPPPRRRPVPLPR